jgi:LmbE family N-acetylglucosaminyl deacetylase
MKVLVVGAHPDDELLGLGGTLIKHIANGDQVYIHLLTDGHTSRYRDSSRAAEQSTEVMDRIESAKRAAAFIGVTDLSFGPFHDQRLDTPPFLEVVQEIESCAKEIQPDIVYAHHKGDANKDHRLVYEACITAFRPVGDHYPVRFLSFETFSSTEWGPATADYYFMPNVFVDITPYLDKKMEALRLYDQEMRAYPHPRSYEGVRTSAKRWGSVIGVQAAEAFSLVREVVF